MTICLTCGHANGMHDDRSCVALNCSCERYIPAAKNVIMFVQPARGPLNVARYPNRPPASLSRSSQKVIRLDGV